MHPKWRRDLPGNPPMGNSSTTAGDGLRLRAFGKYRSMGDRKPRCLTLCTPVRCGLWQEGIYYFTSPTTRAEGSLHPRVRQGKTRKILKTEDHSRRDVAVSPDGRTILYPQFDEGGSDLMLVENFR